ncbi:MAG TPA: hypothetical protein VJ962_13240 [Clostridia bacterium]|nr:hypothetical protein [Clostridia bacterium]
MKFIKSYKFILFLTFLFIFSSLFSVLYIDQKDLPSENWSKEVKLETYSIDNRYDNFETDDNSLLKLGNHFYLVYFSENSYFLNEYDEHFNLIENFTIDENYSLVDYLNTVVIGDEIHMHFLTNEKLISLIINTKGEILSKEIIDEDIKKVKYDHNNIAYLKDDGIYLNGEIIYTLDNIKDFVFRKNNGFLTFAYIHYNLSTYTHDLNILEYENDIISNKTIKSLALDNVTEVYDIDLSISNNTNNLVIITENIKLNVFTNNFFQLDNDYSIIDQNIKYSSGYNFEFIDNTSNYIQNQPSAIGRIDISTKDNKYPNLALFKENGEVKPLTRTKLFPNKVDYYTFDQENYIIFTQTDNNKEISLYLASTDEKIIQKSQNLSFDQIKALFLNTLTTFLPLFLFGQIYSLLFLVPIFVVILPFSLIKITWAEQNQGKLLMASILLFLLAKSKYVIFDMSIQGLPIIFSHPMMRLFIALILSSVSIYSMRDISKDTNNHFLRNFIIFFIIDMITFTLFFTPYFLL